MKKLLLLGLAAFVVILGCSFMGRDFYLGEEDFPDEFTGTLVLILDGSAIPRKDIVPPTVTMEIDHYDLSIVFPDDTNQNFYPEVDGSKISYIKNGLKPGWWDLTILAKDIDNQTIGAIDGVATTPYPFLITAGAVKSIEDLWILPIDGEGDLSLVAEWPDEAIGGTATIDAYLVQVDQIDAFNAAVAAEGDLTSYRLLDDSNNGFTVGTGTATYGEYDPDFPFDYMDDANEPTGYYHLFINLNDDGSKVYGVNDTVRIIAGHESHGTINLTVQAGGVDISWDVDLQNPVGISLSPSQTPAPILGVAPYAAQISVTATLTLPTPASNYYSYRWYMDGVAIAYGTGETGEIDKDGSLTVPYTVEIGDFSSDGFHHLTIVVTGKTASDGTVESISSEIFSFAVDVVE